MQSEGKSEGRGGHTFTKKIYLVCGCIGSLPDRFCEAILYNHSIVINVSKFSISTVIFYFYFLVMLTDPVNITRPHPSTGFNLGSGIAFSCHVSLFSFNLGHFHILCLYSVGFEKYYVNDVSFSRYSMWRHVISICFLSMIILLISKGCVIFPL